MEWPVATSQLPSNHRLQNVVDTRSSMSITQPCLPKPSAAGVYRSLENGRSIRILCVLPGDAADPLRCTLRHARLDNLPPYETISYCWGVAAFTASALLDGTPVSLSASSAAALRGMRLPDLARKVWIDAICINQDDVHERNSQVQLMHDIYSKGERNLVHLGEADMAEAFRSVRGICAWTESAGVGASALLHYTDGKIAMSSGETVPLPAFNTEALIELFSNEWFSRVWTWQEAILPPHCVCYGGAAEIALHDIVRAAGTLAYNIWFIDSALSDHIDMVLPLSWYVEPTLVRKSQRGRLFSFSDHVNVTRHKSCSLPVDRVYGILGLFPQVEITPDYHKPMEDVFQDTVRAVIAHEHSLSVIRMATRLSMRSYSSTAELPTTIRPWYLDQMSQEDEVSEMPSWVPPFYRQSTDLDDMLGIIAGSLPFGACKGRKHEPAGDHVESQEKPRILRVYGVKVGTVFRRAETPRVQTKDWDYGSRLGDMEDLATESLSLRQGDSSNCTISQRLELPEQEIATVLSYCRLADDVVDHAEYLAGYRAYRKISQAEGIDEIPEKPIFDKQTLKNLAQHSEGISEGEWAQAVEFRHNLRRTISYRKLFATDKGRLGVGPFTIEKNDLVVVLNGLEYPAILRPTGEYCQFIGIAYVHGIMCGEAIEQHESRGGEDQVFELC